MTDILDNVAETARHYAVSPPDDMADDSFSDGSPVDPVAEDDPVAVVDSFAGVRNETLSAILATLRATGVTLREGGRRADYQQSVDRETRYLNMARPERFKRPETYLRVLAHELVHATQFELDRPASGLAGLDALLFNVAGIAPEGYVVEEMTAELGGTLFLDRLGILPADGAEQAASYLAGYVALSEDPDISMTTAKARAVEAVDALLAMA